jgi:TP901 family phage tail tape measure protein
MAGVGSGQSMVVGRGLVEILPDFRKWGAQLAADMRLARTQLDGTAAGLRASAKTVGSSMATVGKATSLVGLGVAAASVKMAGDFQAHTAVLQTAAGETSKGLKVVRTGILSISQGTGTGIQNLTDGMYTIEKAGFRGSEGLKVLKAAAQGAREENAKLSDVTNAMTSIMASYHLKATDSVRVMNAMKTAAGEGKITMEEFSGALSTVLPIASANKIKFEDVAGSMATLTQHGTSAREATHELAATIRALASPNMVASREMARFGLSATDVSTKLGQRGLSGTVNLLVETIFKRMGPAGSHLQKIFEGTKQSGQDAQIMLKNMSGDQKKLAQEYLKGNMIQEDWNSTLKGMPVSAAPALRNFKVLVDRSRGFSRELKNGSPASQTFTDSLKKMSGGAIGLNTILQITGESAAGNAERIKKVGESFHNSSKNVEGWKVTAGLLNVQMDRIKQGFQVMAIELGTKLIPMVSAATGFFLAHKSILMALVVTLGSFLAITSATYIGLKLYNTYTRLAAAGTAIFNFAMRMGTRYALGTRIQIAALWVQERLMATWSKIAAAGQWLLNAAMDANPIGLIVLAIAALVAIIVIIATKTQWFQKLWGWVWGAIKKPVMAFVNWLKSNWQLVVWTILTGGIGLAIAMIVRHWDGVKHAFSATIDWVKHNWPLLLSILLGPITAAAYQIYKHWDSISAGAKGVWKAVSGWFVRIGKDIGSFFSKLPGQIGGFFSKLPGQMAGFFSAMWSSISGFFSKLPGEIAKTSSSWGSALASSGENLIKGLWHGAVTFFTKSVPAFFKTIWHGIVDYFKAVFGIHSPSTVMAVLGVDLIRGLFSGMAKIAGTLATWLHTHVYNPTVNFFKNVGGWLVSNGRKVITGFISGQLAIAKGIGNWLHAHVYSPTVNFFRSAGSWLVSHGRKTITGLINGQLAIARTLGGWLSSHIYHPLINFFANAGSWLYTRGRNTITGLYNGFKAIWSSASRWVSGRPAAIKAAIGGLGTLLYQKGKDVLNGFLGGLKSVWKTLTGWVSGIAKWIKDHKGPISLDAKLLTPAGKALMHGLLHGLKIGFKGVGDFIYGTGDTVADVIGKIKNVMKNVGSALGLGNASAVGGAQQYAQLYMKSLGWGPSQWPALKALWMGESGWRSNAYNKSSGATGIPQALPGNKMASEGSDWRTNASTQIRWGEKYIKAVYGNPNNAYSKWLARNPHWYDAGGIAKGLGYMAKNTLQPERVLSPRQTAAFDRLVSVITHDRRGAAPASEPTIKELHLHNHGVIGSKLEVENWLVESLDTLRKKGRIK